MLELRPGESFAGCKIINICGKGGYGSVYLAENAAGKRVAVKLINTNEKKRELQGIKNYMPISQQSPYLLSVFHVGMEQNELFLVMEAADPLPESTYYLPDTLSKRLQLYGNISPAEALDIIKKLASAVQVLHKANLIHRDIKPDNIIFVNGEPKLSDPGLICSTEHSITLAGTLGFLPPECFSGTESNSFQSDIYALGKLFYCIVTGEAPGRFPYMPRDLDFPVCRKLLPILLKACNTKKKKRYNSIDDFQQDLPKKLPTPGMLLQWEDKFRTWRLLHYRVWYGFLLFLFASAVLTSGAVWHQQKKKKALAVLHEKYRLENQEFLKKINAGNRYIQLQLLDLTGEKRSRELMQTYSSLPADPAKGASLSRKYQKQLNAFALQTAGENKKIQNALRRAAVTRAFLKSPLGQFLTAEQKKSIQNDLLLDEKKNQHQFGKSAKLEKIFYPDSSRIFEFAYVPPGFYKTSSGKLSQIDYPLWVAPEKLTVLQFSRMCQFQPPQSRNMEAPAIRFLWNDLLYGCKTATGMFNVVAPLPPGYIVRPLTAEEWEYCASRTVNGKNTFGLYNMGGSIAEIVSSGKKQHKDSVIAMTGKSKKPHREFVFYQSFLRDTGTRLAIAPGTADFFIKEHRTGTPQHFEFNGKHYEFFGHLCASISRSSAEKLCNLLGGKLAVLDSQELIDKVYRTASPIIQYHICVAADWKNGKWYWRNGKLVENAPPPPAQGEYFTMVGKKFTNKVTSSYLGFVCEWTEKEYQNRKNWKQRVKNWPEENFKNFYIDGKEYAFFKLPLSYPHLCRRYAELLGGKLAEPEHPELQMKIADHLQGMNTFATLLGGYWLNGRFYWNSSKNEITLPLALTGQVVDTAPSLSFPAIKDGKLCAIQCPHQFLVEFPSPGQAPK